MTLAICESAEFHFYKGTTWKVKLLQNKWGVVVVQTPITTYREGNLNEAGKPRHELKRLR